MGGGLPAAAFGGRADVMDHLAPAGPVYQAGTLSGNPLATAAGLATLATPPTRCTRRSTAPRRSCRSAASEALTREGVPHSAQHAGQPVLDLLHGRARWRDFAAAQRQDTKAYAAFFHAALERGVYLPPSAYEVWFLSSAHDDAALERVLDALPHAARAAAQASS